MNRQVSRSTGARGRRLVRAGAFLSAGALLVALGVPVSAENDPQVPTLEWEDCDNGLECAVAQVPVDHSDPGKGEIDLQLTRAPATEQDTKVGTIFVDPGVQAGGGSGFVRMLGPQGLEALTQRFDVVGVDARGTGGDPLTTCMTYEEIRSIEPPLAAYQTVEERPDRMREAQQLTQVCEERSGELLPYLGSQDSALDLDLLRQAVDDQKLNYLGLSYGSLTGQYYAASFPERVRTMALDSPIPAQHDAEAPLRSDREQLAATEESLESFFDWCENNPEPCTFGDGDPAEAFDGLVERLEEQRAADPENHTLLTGGDLLVQTVGALLFPASWEETAAELQALEDVEQPTKELPSGPDHMTAATLGNRCLDRDTPSSPEMHDAHFLRAAEASSHFGRVYGYGQLKCAVWPAEPAHPHEDGFEYQGEQPLLVLGRTTDPFVPFDWTSEVTRVNRAKLLTVEGPGHMAFGSGSECVDETVADYFTDMVVPEPGATCATPPPEA